ncbi:radical SAM protein [Kineosporia rhizophila]|uniref:radical SAM protein n=1 Tax=Kineosporia rhizophila TaxID=84633 RepID=UPI001E5374BD|nr:radical SAM protein [Kineosporia rhizophila]MCE0540743.1 radical SAM protein [Kineosporia rhizophila]
MGTPEAARTGPAEAAGHAPSRTFAICGDLIHDPATGLTHHLQPEQITALAHAGEPAGGRCGQPTVRRIRLPEHLVEDAPVVGPAQRDRRLPASVCWSPIVRCNLSCPQCLDDTSVIEAGHADRVRVAGILGGAGVLGVDISGGEPLLLRDLPELLDLLIEAGQCAVSVTTNAWHLERLAARLAPRVDAIRVSLDGPDAARHDAIRGATSFERAAAGIRQAAALGIRVQVQTVLMRSTRAHLQEMTDLARELGAAGLTVLQMLPLGAGANLRHELLSDDEASATTAALNVPAGLRVRLRTRDLAGGFSIVRADGNLWRNHPDAQGIGSLLPLLSRDDLQLTGRDGNA